MNKPKVLVLTGALPYPLVTGAKIRTYNLLKALADEFDIELLTVIASQEEKGYIEEITKAKIKCHHIIRSNADSVVSKGLDAILSFVLPEPYLTRHYTFSKYKGLLCSILSTGEHDVIHCDSISMTGNLKRIEKNKLILTQHNLEQNIWAGYAEHSSNPLTKIFYSNQYHKVRHLEETLNETFGYVVTVSEDDRQKLAASFSKDNIIVVENGVDPAAYRNEIPLNDRSGVVFTGSLDWHPNIDGLTWFADEIYAEMASLMPDCSTKVVGRKPARAVVNALTGKDGIAIHSDVPEIQPYLNAARVMMVPLRIGGGSRLKILEAMAAGIPVVSTTKGAEGLAVRDGENIIIEDNPKQFAEALVKVLQDGSLHNSLSVKGRELIERKYSWDQVSRPLAGLWEKVAHA